MEPAEIAALADRFFAAIESGDVDTLRELYTDDAMVWHNYDQAEQPVEANLRVLRALHRDVHDLQYTEIRRTVLEDGFVQQHILRGTAQGGDLVVPAMLRIYVRLGKVSRIEEYLDTRQVDVLRRPA